MNKRDEEEIERLIKFMDWIIEYRKLNSEQKKKWIFDKWKGKDINEYFYEQDE